MVKTISPSVLADVAFVFLIVWIISTFIMPNRSSASAGLEGQNAISQKDITITIQPDNAVIAQGRKVLSSDIEHLYYEIMKCLAVDPGQTISLVPGPGAEYGDIVRALDVLRTIERDLRATSPEFSLALSVHPAVR